MSELIRPVAFYLPQFHPIPENDDWWGKGFTEWTNVTKAKPLFKGHYQPHLPADLGFYDLRMEETRVLQAQLAKESGIYGFCYYHYWFNGRRLLERPLNEVLSTGKPDFPFMLCWANENWTRIWDGGEKEVLLAQSYSLEDNLSHIRSLLPVFHDPRYIKVDGKPVFIIYRSALIPDLEKMIECWRTEAFKNGLELYLCRVEAGAAVGPKYLKEGFDAAVNFEPFSIRMEAFNEMKRSSHLKNKLTWWYFKYKFSSDDKRKEMLKHLCMQPDYCDYVDFIKKNTFFEHKCYPGITPMWDNTARRKQNPFLFRNSSPQKYQEWLEHELSNFKSFSKEENFLFINAWNEWAEGNHLEPCSKYGMDYLKATRQATIAYT